MNNNKKCLIKLLSSHLNSIVPSIDNTPDWNEVYHLADINDVSAIIASEIKKLPNAQKPDKLLQSYFKQFLGKTIIDYEAKSSATRTICSLFDKNGIDYLLIKGAVLRSYYPVKELRTSGDIDIIIRQRDLEKVKEIIYKQYTPYDEGTTFTSIRIDGQAVEIQSDIDLGFEYFNNIFSLCSKNENKYYLNDIEHLIFLIYHTKKHMKLTGIGVRMIMDIDVLIRHIDDFDYEAFMTKCSELGFEAFARYILSLSKVWFNTPINAKLEVDEKMLELFERHIVSAGTFGFELRGLSDYYINQTKNGSKLSAILHFIFPKRKTLITSYEFCYKHPVLLPIAWLRRLFDGIFRRGRHSAETLKGIIKSESNDYTQLLNELDI